jgi:hypothetical protein
MILCGLFLNVYWDHDRHALCMHIGNNNGDGTKKVAVPVALEFVDWPEGAYADPTVVIPKELAVEFLSRAAEALDRVGVKTTDEARLGAALEATRYHLEDLRHLLKVDERDK